MSVVSPELITYDRPIEDALRQIVGLIGEGYQLSRRAVGLLLLQEDPEIMEQAKMQNPESFPTLLAVIEATRQNYPDPLNYVISMERQSVVEAIIREAVVVEP